MGPSEQDQLYLTPRHLAPTHINSAALVVALRLPSAVMNIIWLCITSVLSISVNAGQHVDRSNIRVFPAMDQSIAGVFQVTFFNHRGQAHYAFNASEARTFCLSLGVEIASKAQVEDALGRGLETCRFGWIDEHLAVIPRINPRSACGQSKTGVVTWRATVDKKFDVFCFNESDAATQLQDATSTSPTTTTSTSSRDQSTHSTQTTHPTSSSPHPSSASSTPKTSEAEAARYVGGAQRSAGGKVVLIISCCSLLLTAIIIVVYFKMRKLQSQSADVKQQQQQPDDEYIETEDWTCARPRMEQTEEEAPGEEKVEMEDEDKVSIELSQSDVTE